MAQLQEDEWPEAGEPTTTEREAADVRNHGEEKPPAPTPVPPDDARLKNVTPDEAVD